MTISKLDEQLRNIKSARKNGLITRRAAKHMRKMARIKARNA